MAKNETPTLPELYEGVQNGEYIPYICTGGEWVPWDKELALEDLRARAETLGGNAGRSRPRGMHRGGRERSAATR